LTMLGWAGPNGNVCVRVITSMYVCVLCVCVCVHWQRSKVDAAADSSAPTDEDEKKEQESGKLDAAADDA
jgi:hypothetical protein